MLQFFNENATLPRRAYQVWLILVGRARNRQTITYSQLAELLGYGDPRPLSGPLDYLMHYCDQEDLPPLTCIVVSKITGKPGDGMREYSLADQEDVFSYDWYNLVPPSPEVLEEMYRARKGG